MEIIDPDGKTVLDADGDPVGGSLDSPERVVLAKPAPGKYTVLVQGFLIWPQGSSGHGDSGHGNSGHGDSRAGKDTYTLTATADGNRLRVSK